MNWDNELVLNMIRLVIMIDEDDDSNDDDVICTMYMVDFVQ